MYIDTYIHIYMYICMHVCMYLYIQVHTHTHTHTHTYTCRVSRRAGEFANVCTCSMPICVCKRILYGLRKKLAKSALIIDWQGWSSH